MEKAGYVAMGLGFVGIFFSARLISVARWCFSRSTRQAALDEAGRGLGAFNWCHACRARRCSALGHPGHIDCDGTEIPDA